jgi:hypothetical protein
MMDHATMLKTPSPTQITWPTKSQFRKTVMMLVVARTGGGENVANMGDVAPQLAGLAKAFNGN